jgi:PAS domain S-box-containing protein
VVVVVRGSSTASVHFAPGQQRYIRFGVWGLLARQLLLVVGLASLTFARPAFASEPATTKNVLLLYSFSDRSVAGYGDALKSAIRSRVPSPVNFYVEYIESRHLADQTYERGLVETLRATYSVTKLDLIIVDAYPALQFAVRHRNDLFPSQPIVFFDVDGGRIAGQKMWPGVTGVTETVNARRTIDLALHLHPDTNAVAVITNSSEFERYWLSIVHGELLRHQDKVKEIDLVGFPPSQLLEKVAALPPHTVVLFQESALDSSQPAIGTYDVLAIVGQRLPTYCVFPIQCLNRGGIGGADVDISEQISLTAEAVRHVMAGEPPDSIPVMHGTSYAIQVDWRQLRRWNIPESALPPGTIVLYRQPTVWEQYEKYILAGVVLIIIQSLLIIGLLWQRERKRKSETELRESEKRFRIMANTTPSLVWMCDKNGAITFLNERRIDFTGSSSEAGFDDIWKTFVHPDDLEHVVKAKAEALQRQERFSREYRLRRHDGVYRWMFDVAAPRSDAEGKFAGFIGSASDITDQKLAQEALEKVGGRLIEAQEQERSRIARELHDDICQRLALISLELQQTHERSDDGDGETRARIVDIQQHCSEVAGDVQALSHQLHSSKLDYLGLASALRSFCREFSIQKSTSIEFKDENVPSDLPRDVSLCLFRVAQEALSNAVKYSGTTRISMDLRGTTANLRLEIRDAGVGFDVEEAKAHAGLGLVSMQERVRLVNGTFSVKSKRNQGTTIEAIVPLQAKVDAFSARA